MRSSRLRISSLIEPPRLLRTRSPSAPMMALANDIRKVSRVGCFCTVVTEKSMRLADFAADFRFLIGVPNNGWRGCGWSLPREREAKGAGQRLSVAELYKQ